MEKLYRYIGDQDSFTVGGQEFLKFRPATEDEKAQFGEDYVGSNLGFRADTPEIAAEIEVDHSDLFEVV